MVFALALNKLTASNWPMSLVCALLAGLVSSTANANAAYELCLKDTFALADANTTVGEIRERCAQKHASRTPVIKQRLVLERENRTNPFSLTAHRPNYLLPAVYLEDPIEVPGDSKRDTVNNLEAQFQLSIKGVVWENLLGYKADVYAAYTNRSFWQVYNATESRPFRETNHEPELILEYETGRNFLGFYNATNSIILNHHSNGRGGDQSRSWNRIKYQTTWEKNNVLVQFSPWYRLKEDDEDDDNSDIEFYLGHFELLSAWPLQGGHTLSAMLRNNLRSESRGAIELGWTFPFGRGDLFIKYFNGYGESLIDYNRSTQSLGIGFAVTDWF